MNTDDKKNESILDREFNLVWTEEGLNEVIRKEWAPYLKNDPTDIRVDDQRPAQSE